MTAGGAHQICCKIKRSFVRYQCSLLHGRSSYRLLAQYPQLDKNLGQGSQQKAPPIVQTWSLHLDLPIEVGYNCYKSGSRFHRRLLNFEIVFAGGTVNWSQVGDSKNIALIIRLVEVDRCLGWSLRFRRSTVTRYFRSCFTEVGLWGVQPGQSVRQPVRAGGAACTLGQWRSAGGQCSSRLMGSLTCWGKIRCLSWR